MSGLKRFPLYNEVFKDGELNLTPYNLEALENLVIVVVNKHFSHYTDVEDLKSVGMLKCIELLQSGAFDPAQYPQKSALKNFLYTGIRNEVGNYIYHNKNSKKEVVVEDTPINATDLMDRSLMIESHVNRFCKENHLKEKEFTYYLKTVGLPIRAAKTDLTEIDHYSYNKLAIIFIHEFVKYVM